MKKSSKVFKASEESKNVYGFTVLTIGIDRTDFDNNPVLLYNHDYDKLIGLCVDVHTNGPELLYTPSFDEEDKYAMKQFSKAEQGILRGSSIGIIPIEYDEANQIMKRCSLKEISLTPVPANRNAIAIYNTKGQMLSASEAKEYLLSLSPKTTKDTLKNNMKQSLITALVALCVQAGHTITLSDKSTEDEFESGLKQVGVKLTSLSTENTKLSGEVKTLKDAKDKEEKDEHADLLKKAVDEKLLTAETLPAFESLSLPNLKVVLSTMKPVTLSTIETGKETTITEQKDERKEWGYDEFALNAPDDLAKMEITDNARFTKLLSAKAEKARQTNSIAV